MILGMIATHGSHLRITGEGVFIFLGYGLFFWRTFKSNPGTDRVRQHHSTRFSCIHGNDRQQWC